MGQQARRLSEIRLIYCGCAGFGQILRSFSFNRPHYSPQTIEQSDSNRHNLVTITTLGQPPSRFSFRQVQLKRSDPLTLFFVVALILGPVIWVDSSRVRAQNLVLTPTLNAPVGRHPGGLTVGDFNADGFLDVATVNSDSDDATILLGNGNGTFRSGVSFGVGKSPMFVAAGDLNGDEILDLVVAETGADGLLVMFGKGNGLFGRPMSYPSGKGPTFVVLSDLDGDQDLDVVAVNSGRFGYYPPFSLSVFLNQGEGRLGEARIYESAGRDGMFPTGVSAADLNRDGLPDLAIAWSQPSWRTPNGLVSFLINEGDGTFIVAKEIQAGLTLSALIQADLDMDGDLDLVTASAFTDSLVVLIQELDGSYQRGRHFGVGFSPVALAVVDLDGDKRLDLVAANRASSSVSILLGKGDGSFRPAGHYGVGATPTSLAVKDFDRDGLPDLVTANSDSNDVSILLSGSEGIPSITLSTDAVAFDDHGQRRERQVKTVTVSNVGLGPLKITNIVLEGRDPWAFSVRDGECRGATLTTGKLCALQIDYTSQTPGNHQARITILDNAPGGPRFVTLSGTVKG